MIDIGSPAPDFELKNQDGQPVKLSDYRGKRVLLAFYPFAFSSVCADEFSCIREDMSQFRNDTTEVLGISVDSHYAQKAFADSLGITHPLLSDFGKTATESYGVLRPEGFSERAYFVVDPEGTVAWKQVMPSPGERLENSELLAVLK